MGVMNHNAVIATGWSDDDEVRNLQGWIDGLPEDERKLFARIGSWANGHTTFVLGPDGSKEGWATSDQGDALRCRFISRLSEEKDGGSCWEWIEVGFGEFGQKVLRGNCTNRYTDEEYAS